MSTRGWPALGWVIGVMIWLWVSEAEAGEGLTMRAPGRNDSISTRAGFDDSLVTWTLGYTRAIPLPRVGRVWMIGGELSVPMAGPDFGDVRVQASARIDALWLSGFELPLEFGGRMIRTRNDLFTGVGLGTLLAAYPGWYALRWFVAAELRWDQTWATRLTHSAVYREEIYPDVRDGWYGAPAWSMRYGLRVGGLIRTRVELMARGGYQHVGGINAVIPPVYVDLTIGVRF